MKTKKKVLVAALAVALLAIMVGGSLAYFTAGDEVTNTFTIGSVLIDILENDLESPDDVLEFDEPLIPVVEVNDPASDESYIPKKVEVKNTGLNGAYIRTHIAIPTALVNYLVLDWNVTTDWTFVGQTTCEKEDVAYTVYTYDYVKELEAGKETPALLNGVYLASDVDIKDNPATATADLEFCKPNGDGTYTFSGFTAHEKVTNGYKSAKVNVLVFSQAIQAQGFDDPTDALDTGFGQGKNPWRP